MKKTILIFLLLTGCGSAKFMNWLKSTGNSFVEGVELGKKAKSLMFECDFDDQCFFAEFENLLEKECKNPEKFEMVSYKECFVYFNKQMEEIYYHNKQAMGYSDKKQKSRKR